MCAKSLCFPVALNMFIQGGDVRVQFGQVLSKISWIVNWTLGLVQPFGQTLNQTSGSGSLGSKPWTEPNNFQKYHLVFKKIFNDHRHDFLCLITQQDLLHYLCVHLQHISGTQPGYDSEHSRTCVEDIALPLMFIRYTWHFYFARFQLKNCHIWFNFSKVIPGSDKILLTFDFKMTYLNLELDLRLSIGFRANHQTLNWTLVQFSKVQVQTWASLQNWGYKIKRTQFRQATH